MSKVKNKLKEEQKKEKEQQEVAPGLADPAPVEQETKEADDKMVGSIEEYASLVGKSVSNLRETKYEAPEVEPSDDDESEEEGDDLWGAIMGGS